MTNVSKKKIVLCLVMAMGAAVVSSAHADMVTVGALQDAMIFGNPGGTASTGNASGKGPALFAGTDGGSSVKRSLIEFDIASARIPAGATITGVSMRLVEGILAGSGGSSNGTVSLSNSPTISIYDIQQNWSEGNSDTLPSGLTSPTIGGSGQGSPAGNGDATWDYANFNSNASLATKWNVGGTNLLGGNINLPPSGAKEAASAGLTFSSFTAGTNATWSSSAMVTDVQSWVDGTTANNGWELISNLETGPRTFIGFWSKDGAAANAVANNDPSIVATLAPELTITFTVPEPTSLSIVGAGVLMLAARRRRPADGSTTS